MKKIIIRYSYLIPVLVLSCVFASCAGIAVKSTSAPVAVSIDAAKAVRTIQPEIFGQNIAVWEGTADGKDAAYNEAVKAMSPSVIRFPGGGYADLVDWENINSCGYSWVPITTRKGIDFANACGAKLQIEVNYSGFWCDKENGHDAAVKKAADWVRYMNVTGGGAHKVKYWEIGNEQFVSGEKGFWSDDEEGGDKYGTEFVDFYNAMKKVDPDIKIGAQCQYDHVPFTTGVLKALKKKNCIPDFLITHIYPIWVPDRDAEKAPNWDRSLYAANDVLDGRIMDSVYHAVSATAVQDGLVSRYLGKKYAGKIPYMCTEFRSVQSYKFDEYVDAMFCSQFILELGRLGWNGANLWDLKNGYSRKTSDDFGLLRTGVNADMADDNPKDSPRPTYYVYPYLSNIFGKDLVECKFPEYTPNAVPGRAPYNWKLSDASGSRVRAWASKDAAGDLTVFLVNNDRDNNAQADINIAGFNAGAKGKSWTFEAAGKTYYGKEEPMMQRMHIKINGIEDPAVSSLPGEGFDIATGSNFTVKMPAGSMILIKIPATK
jgi:alpha-L-arabinofuranosidase